MDIKVGSTPAQYTAKTIGTDQLKANDEASVYNAGTITVNAPGAFNENDKKYIFGGKDGYSQASPSADDLIASAATGHDPLASVGKGLEGGIADFSGGGQAALTSRLYDTIQALGAERASLMADLQDPDRQVEAQARADLIDWQLQQLQQTYNQVQRYVPSQDASGDNGQAADIFNQIGDQIEALADPSTSEAAQSTVNDLFASLGVY